ncbi:MAG TPA: hypothetical protein VGD48_35770 [Kutzneria sp.]|jgi:hypothetical protein
MTGRRLSFDEFVAPLRANAPTPDRMPLAELPVGDYALVTWLDDVHARNPFDVAVEAEIVARWDTASLRDVYALVFPDADTDLPGAPSS